MSNVYILNKKPEETINQVYMILMDSFKAALEKQYFQGQRVSVTSENAEELSKVVVAITSKFVAKQIKQVCSVQSIDPRKVREMFYTCIEKFLQEM